MRYYRFLEDAGVHVIDYSGKVDLAEGLFRMEQLEKCFGEYIDRGNASLKILFDVRKVIWESEPTHDMLAKTARQRFGTVPGNVRRYIAVVNNQYDGSVSANEHWFTSEDEALGWLSKSK
jgi:hypothetical protein